MVVYEYFLCRKMVVHIVFDIVYFIFDNLQIINVM